MLTPLCKAFVVVACTHNHKEGGAEQCNEGKDSQSTEKRPVDESEAENSRVEHHGPRKQEEKCDGQERPGQFTTFAAHRVPTLYQFVNTQGQMVARASNVPSSTRGTIAE